MKRLRLLVIFTAVLALLLLACETRQPLPSSLVKKLRTPDGTEIQRTCPPPIEQVADPTKVAELLNRNFDFYNETLGPEDFGIPPEVMNPPDSPALLIPTAAPLGAQVSCCSDLTNQEMGDPNFGSFASEEQLNQLGRLCGFTADSVPEAYQIRLDYYRTTPGAKEAYRREAALFSQYEVSNLDTLDQQALSSIGEDRVLGRTISWTNGVRDEADEFTLFIRRRNVIASIDLQYVLLPGTHQGPPTPLLQYAAQLDRNIEAAAQQGG